MKKEDKARLLLRMLTRIRGKRLNPLSRTQWFAIGTLSWVLTLIAMFDYGVKRGFRQGLQDGFESVAYHECQTVATVVLPQCVENLTTRYQAEQPGPRWRLRNPADKPIGPEF